MNLRPSGYEPDELPDCSTPRSVFCFAAHQRDCAYYAPFLSAAAIASLVLSVITFSELNVVPSKSKATSLISLSILYSYNKTSASKNLRTICNRKFQRNFLLHKKRLDMHQVFELRGPDLNQQPSGYEPDELPGCSTPRYSVKTYLFHKS